AADKRKGSVAGSFVTSEIIAKCLHEAMARRAHIGVVIAGDRGHEFRRPDAREPFARRWKFCLQREIDEIARDGDVIGRLRLHVGDQRVQHVAPVIPSAIAGPIEVTQRALPRELGQPRPGQRRQMWVRQMRELESGHVAIYWQASLAGARSKAMSERLGSLRRRLEPLLRRIFHLYWWLARGMTLGVR